MKNGEIINLEKVTCRPFNLNETLSLLQFNRSIYWSWGTHALKGFTIKGEPKALRFAVQGYHHKGHVYIVLNGQDLYDVYFTTRKGKIVDSKCGIYFDMLVDVIDKRVEKIPEYVNYSTSN